MRDHLALCLVAVTHPGTGWPARSVLAVTLAYALSPIDLIPDIVPVLGLLDDLLLVPLGLGLAMRLIPPAVLDACRQRLQDDGTVPGTRGLPAFGAVGIVLLWLVGGLGLWRLLGS